MPKRIKKETPRPIPLAAGLAVALAAVLTYTATASYPFTLDDHTIVAYNPAVQQWGNWQRVFWHDYWPLFPSSLYRPITIFSFALERVIHGSQPIGFHIVNILLHGAVSSLVFLLASELAVSFWGALFAGLIFAVHPIHTEVVAGVVGRSELLSSLFVVMALWCWIRARRDGNAPRGSRYLTILALYFLAMASKENAVIFPALIILWELSRDRAGAFLSRLREALVKSRLPGFAAVAIAFLVLRVAALGGVRTAFAPPVAFIENPLIFESTSARILTGLANQWHGLILHVMPLGLIADYSYDTLPIRRSALDPSALAMIIFIIACLSAWFGKSRTVRDLSFASSWHLVSVLPASNIPVLIGTIFGERLFYLPSVGVCLALGIVLASVPGPAAPVWKLPAATVARLALGFAAAVIVIFSILSLVRLPAWESNLSLFTVTVKQAPRNAKARALLGDSLVEAGKLEEAVEEYRQALKIYPDYAWAAAGLVSPLTQLHRIPEAIQAGEKALVLFRGLKNSVLLHVLALAYLEGGDPVRFLDYISRSLELDPENARAHVALGMYYMQHAGDRERARHHFQEALRLNPRMTDAPMVRSLLSRVQ